MTLYQRFEARDFTIRDYLALERTILSTERTLLAYWRTGLALLAVGFTGFHFFETQLGTTASIALAVGGAAVGMIGTLRFFNIKRRLDLASPEHSAEATAENVSAAEQLNPLTEDD